MKLFKRIYYPIMIVLVIVMLILGFVDSNAGGMASKYSKQTADATLGHVKNLTEFSPNNSYNQINQENVRNYIWSELSRTGSKIKVDNSNAFDGEGNNTVNYTTVEGKKVPSAFKQKIVVTQDTMSKAASYDKTVVGKEINNIIIAIPGTSTTADASGNAVLVNVPYDSSALGGASDMVAVAAMIENAIAAANGSYTNDIVFLFADAAKDGGYGTLAFLHQFTGFDNISARVKLAANFETNGNGAGVMLYDSSDDNLNLIAKYSKINGGALATSFSDFMFGLTKGTLGSGIFGDMPALGFNNFNGSTQYGTANDTVDNLNKSFITQQIDAMQKFYNMFGNEDLTKLDTKADAVYFSYLDIATFWYPVAVGFVIAALILGLVIAVILINRKRKAFSVGKAIAGAGVQLLTVLAAALTLFVFYYLFAIILCGFGVITINAIPSLIFTSPFLLVAAIIFSMAIAAAYYIIFKRTFMIKAPDVVRGNVLLWSLVAIIISFAAPKISYFFAIFALLQLVVLLVSTLCKDKFKAKTGLDIERLFLYVWASVLVLPLLIPIITLVGSTASMMLLPILMAAFIGTMGTILPYFDYLKPTFDKVAKKLPARTIKYERVVTEKVEDKAKKGKFSEVTVKKIFKEKVRWGYLNRVGIAIVCVVSAVLILFATSFGTTYSMTLAKPVSYSDSIYDDSMLLVWEKTIDGVDSANIEIYDHMAYKHINLALNKEKLNNFKWDSKKKAYTKSFDGDITSIMPSKPSIAVTEDEDDKKKVSFNTYESGYSSIRVTLTAATEVKSVIFNKGDVNRESEQYTYSGKETIVFDLPYGYDDFDMIIDGSCTVSFEQHVYNAKNLEGNNTDWEKVYEYYLGNDAIYNAIRSGMVFKMAQAI